MLASHWYHSSRNTAFHKKTTWLLWQTLLALDLGRHFITGSSRPAAAKICWSASIFIKVFKTKDHLAAIVMPCTCCSGTQRHLEHYGYQNFNFQLKHSILNTYHVCFLLGFCNKECIHHKIFAEKQKNYRNFFAHLFVSPWPSIYSRTTSSPVFLITLLSFLELLSRWTQVTAMGNPACHSLQQRHQPCMALEGLMDNVQNSLRELLALYKNFFCQRRTHVGCGCICSMTLIFPFLHAAPMAVHLETAVSF